MKSRFNSLYLGLILGVIFPIISLCGYYLVNFNEFAFSDFVKMIIARNIYVKILALCVLPNLLLFFIFIWKNYLTSARGVLMATIICAVIIIILKFFT